MSQSRGRLRVDSFLPRDVIDFSYQFNKPVDPDNQVAGRARGGKITVTVKSRLNGNNELLSWLLDNKIGKKGEIITYNNEDGIEREIYFQDGFCVDYVETWKDIQLDKDGKPKENLIHTEKIIISSKTIVVKGGNQGETGLVNDWTENE